MKSEGHPVQSSHRDKTVLPWGPTVQDDCYNIKYILCSEDRSMKLSGEAMGKSVEKKGGGGGWCNWRMGAPV